MSPRCVICGVECVPVADHEPRVVCLRCDDTAEQVLRYALDTPKQAPRPVERVTIRPNLFSELRDQLAREWAGAA